MVGYSRNMQKYTFCFNEIVAVVYALSSAPPAAMTIAMLRRWFMYNSIHPPAKMVGTAKTLVVNLPTKPPISQQSMLNIFLMSTKMKLMNLMNSGTGLGNDMLSTLSICPRI